jgi:glutamate 5-kinase
VNFGSENSIELKQAAAAVGQSELMNIYSRNFTPYGHTVAQILLTKDAIDNSERFEHAKKTFELLLDNGVIPVVNENDSVSCEGIKFGGNDILSAYVAIITKADLLINLTDVDGLFDSDPRSNPNAKLITNVTNFSDVENLGSGAGTLRGTGGMQAKLISAKMASEAGVPTFVANGLNPEILYDIIDGKAKGTYFAPCKD